MRALLSVAVMLSACASAETYSVVGDDDFIYRIEGDMAFPIATGEVPLAAARGPEVVFLNFAGPEIAVAGWALDNAQANASFIPAAASKIPKFKHKPWGPERKLVKADILARLAARFDGYSVDFVGKRPSEGAYTMVVIGGRPEDIGRTGGVGIAPVDPSNYNPSDVAFVYSEVAADFGYTTEGLADIISHEVAHSVGLLHIDRHGDIMYPSACHCAMSWGQGPLVGQAGEQDDEELLAVAFPPPQPAPEPAITSEAPTADGLICGGAEAMDVTGVDRPVSELRQVGRLYCAILDRLPTGAELVSGVDRVTAGDSVAMIADELLASADAVIPQQSSDVEFVTALYRVTRDQEPDETGLGSWTAALTAGFGRGNIASSIASTPDARALLDPLFIGE